MVAVIFKKRIQHVVMLMKQGIQRGWGRVNCSLMSLTQRYPGLFKRKWLVGVCVFLGMVGVLMCVFMHVTKPVHQKTSSEKTLALVKTLDVELQALQVSEQSTRHQTQAQKRDQDKKMAHIQAQLAQLKDQKPSVPEVTSSQVNKAVASSAQAEEEKMRSLEEQISALKASLIPKHYLSQKILPFNVVSIDYWNGRPYATLEMVHRYALLGLNESRAGWTVKRLDMEQGVVLLENTHKQFVKVTL